MKWVFLASCLLVLVGCSSMGLNVSTAEDFWYNDQSKMSDLYYCKAHSTKEGANPVCFAAKKMYLK